VTGKRSKAARRAQLIEAAERAFAERGVENTTVSDIVGAAGVAQGTFYLYFDSKDHVLVAVAEGVVDRMVRVAEARLDGGASAAEQLRDFIGSLGDFERDRSAVELAETLHRSENRLLHDRLEEQLIPRLVPLMERIVERGRAEGVFRVSSSRAAAWFVLGGVRGAELAGTPPAEIPAALEAATELVLRALGYHEVGHLAVEKAGGPGEAPHERG
jgi:AcrR family transcriptional regulator